MVFRRFIETWTTLSGSVRGDARFLAGRISRRCAAALELSADEAFRRMGAQAQLAGETANDVNRCTDREARVTLKALIAMEQEVARLEIARGIREKVTERLKAEIPQTTPPASQKGVDLERQAASEPEKNVRTAALQLWGQLVVNIESFPDEKFATLGEALERAGTSLDVLRKEVFAVYFLAFEFVIVSRIQKGNAGAGALRSLFMTEVLEFISKNSARWGSPEEFLTRMGSYRSALSSYFDEVKSSGTSGDIVAPIRQVFWPAIMGHEATGRILLSDAEAIKVVADQALDTFLPLTQLAARELHVPGIIADSAT